MNHAYFLPLCHMQDTHPPQARRGRRRRWSNRDNFLNRYAAAAVKGKLETREACASASIMAVTTYKANFACLRKGLPGEIIWGNMHRLINFLKLNMRLIYLNSVRRVVWLLHHTDVSSELFQLTRGKSDTQYIWYDWHQFRHCNCNMFSCGIVSILLLLNSLKIILRKIEPWASVLVVLWLNFRAPPSIIHAWWGVDNI